MTYEYEMIWGTDETIKGDAQIMARGAAAILVKEAQRQGRMQALQVVGANPMAMQIVGLTGYGKLLQNALRSMDGADDDVVPDEKDLAKMQDQQTQQQAEQLRQQQAAAAAQQQFIGDQNDRDRQNKIDVANITARSRESIHGATLGAKMAEQVASKPKRVAFKYDAKGNIIAAEHAEGEGANPQPAQPAKAPA
jgi:hypothetical protein